jgi:hypothetical protein
MSTVLATERMATPYRWRWRVLGVVLLAGVMDLVDSTVMNVAAPSVHAGIGGSEATLQWLAAGYTLAFGVLFVIGAIGFTLASAACVAFVTAGSALLVYPLIQGREIPRSLTIGGDR